MVATKPVAGSPVESVWGGQVHDAAVGRRGVAVTCANSSAIAGAVPLDINAVADGDASMADLAGNAVVIPFAGLWRIDIEAQGSGVSTGTGGYGLIVRNNGGAIFGCNGAALGGTGVRIGTSGIRHLAAGDRLDLQLPSCGGAASGTLTFSNIRLTVSLEAQDLV